MLLMKVPRKNGEIVRYGGHEFRVSNLKLKYERNDIGRRILVARFVATCTDAKCNNEIRSLYYNGATNVLYEYADSDESAKSGK